MKESLPEDQLLQLSDFVADQMGLYFPRKRWEDLERQTNLAAKEFGYPDAKTFVPWLLSSSLTQEQIEILASCLTISETYFWREPQVFEALRHHILPELIRLRETGNRRLRIWSAGCASGEEPYTIAIVLRQLIPDLKNWNITLLATDINPNVLRRAAAGVYGEWSFRNSPPGLKQKYFIRTANNKFEILPEIRQMVTFAYLNLAKDLYPSPMNNTNAMDLVFCRNVLMYFATEHARQVGLRLYQSLIEGGWLIVGSSELSQHIFPQAASVHFPGAIVYRREGEKSRPEAVPPLAPALAPTIPILLPSRPALVPPPFVPSPALHARKRVQPAEAVETVRVEARPDVGVTVRSLANRGKLTEAWAACEQAITADRLNPGLYYLGATILQELDRKDEAMASLKRALYLDPGFVLAYFTLGTLLLRQGNTLAAKKSFENVLALLSSYEQEDMMPESEGLTAGRLREITRATLHTGIPA